MKMQEPFPTDNSWREIRNRTVSCHEKAFSTEYSQSNMCKETWLTAYKDWYELFSESGFWHWIDTRAVTINIETEHGENLCEIIKKHLINCFIEVHKQRILELLSLDSDKAKYHFDILDTFQSIFKNVHCEHFIEKAKNEIFTERLPEEYLQQKNDTVIKDAIKSAQPLHRIYPSATTSDFLLRAHLSLVRCHYSQFVSYIQQEYTDYYAYYLRPNSDESVDEEAAGYEGAIIKEDPEVEDYLELYEEAILDLEQLVFTVRNMLRADNPSSSIYISEAYTRMGAYYRSTINENRDIDLAIEYFEEALKWNHANREACSMLENTYDEEE